MVMETNAWVIRNCKFASGARTAIIVSYALRSMGIRLSSYKVASIMKVALPSDWGMLSWRDKNIIETIVHNFYRKHLSETGFTPKNPTVSEVYEFLKELSTGHLLRVSVDEDMMKSLSEYVSNNWTSLTEPTGNTLETLLDTMEPEDSSGTEFQVDN